MADSNYVIYKNGKVFANVDASKSTVDGMGTRLLDEAGEVVFSTQESGITILKGPKADVEK